MTGLARLTEPSPVSGGRTRATLPPVGGRCRASGFDLDPWSTEHQSARASMPQRCRPHGESTDHESTPIGCEGRFGLTNPVC